MISAVSILSQTGEIILLKTFRNDFNSSAFENYRLSLFSPNEIPSPAVLVDGISFLCHQEKDLFYVACTKQNADANVIFELLTKLPNTISKVLNIADLSGSSIVDYVADIIEMLDEMIDSGYPQITEPETLVLLLGRNTVPTTPEHTTAIATGALPWRIPNVSYKQHKVFVDVIEKFSYFNSGDGTRMTKYIEGVTTMNAMLSGMPQCTFVFNAKVTPNPLTNEQHVTSGNIDFDEIIFHPCVKLDKFLSNKEISFIPPDGIFDLMRYQKADGFQPPFEIVPSLTATQGNNLDLVIKVNSTYDRSLRASPLLLTIPLPQNTANVSFDTSGKNKPKFDELTNSVVWSLPDFPGQSNAQIHITAQYLSAIYKCSSQSKLTLPINVEFHILKLSPSGLSLLNLVFDQQNKPDLYLKYITENGRYQVVIPYNLQDQEQT